MTGEEAGAVPRRLLCAAVAAGLAGAGAATHAAPAPAPAPAAEERVRLGAIRWDAWYGADRAPGSSEWYAAHNLDPEEYHGRAPWFATLAPGNRLSINGGQAEMDAELRYAANAGIDFWAFGWYPAGRPIHQAWEHYQNSPDRALVNWCVLVGTGSLAAKFPPVAALVGYFRQPGYERHDGRPLLFVMHEAAALGPAAAALAALRQACAERGAGNPYVVLQSAVATLAASDMVAIGADAVGAYAHSAVRESGGMAYRALAAETERFDAALVATGKPVLPLVMTGWDRRPRIDHPPPFDHTVAKGFVEPGTPAEIAAHAAAVVARVKADPGAFPSRRVLIYSWNECDEGGSVLVPTWTPHGPDAGILRALAAIPR